MSLLKPWEAGCAPSALMRCFHSFFEQVKKATQVYLDPRELLEPPVSRGKRVSRDFLALKVHQALLDFLGHLPKDLRVALGHLEYRGDQVRKGKINTHFAEHVAGRLLS